MTRLKTITYTTAKRLPHVANRRFLFRELGQIADNGIIIFPKTTIYSRELLGDKSRWSHKITYISQNEPLGLAHSMRTTKPLLSRGLKQHPEKSIPMFILNAWPDNGVYIHGDLLHVRDWAHVLDRCRTIDLITHKSKLAEAYNRGVDNDQGNAVPAVSILGIWGKPESLLTSVRDRSGHYSRCSIDSFQLRAQLDWEPSISFGKNYERTSAATPGLAS